MPNVQIHRHDGPCAIYVEGQCLAQGMSKIQRVIGMLEANNPGFDPDRDIVWFVKINDAPAGKDLIVQSFDPMILRDWVYSHNG